MTDSKDIEVMVIEDETSLLKAITKKITVLGVGVVPFSSGEEALEYLSKTTRLPSVIWLDFYLKGTNGLEIARKLKEKPEWSNIPIVVISNSASPEKVKNMLSLGAKKYLLKAAYRIDDLVREVVEIAKGKED